jgi:sortase A
MGWGAAQRFGLWALRETAQQHRDERASPVLAGAPHPTPSPQGGGARKRRYLALAILFLGLVATAAALYIPAKAQLSQFLMSRAWDYQLANGQPARPWPWADFTPAAKLDFPAQHRSVLALTDASGESLAFGPTLLAASARPGQRGVTVFAAHRDTHFAFLGQLKPGDKVRVETRDGTVSYRITGSEVVHWNASGIQPHDNGPPRLALVTCWPLDANFRGVLRLVVWGERIDG